MTSPLHNRIARRLACALESAPCVAWKPLKVETGIDVLLSRPPESIVRRPDVVIYTCLDVPGRSPDASETVGVVEVSTPGTMTDDLTSKLIQYSTAGIPLYLVILLDEKHEIEEVREFHLDAVVRSYRLHRLHRTELELEAPFLVTIPFGSLTAP
ncbi:Uma2 family endonuclease [Nonomuraea typhae]|uniref:Uma2 family endonuclease n=1 Tax=Nonomuraea typhae TaxID=2603600 RepID=UPI0012FA072C|nr:Uma2 family endonuclease [Nonomuraea typhae]